MLSWLEGFFGAFVAILGKLLEPVKRLAQAIVQWVTSWIQKVVDWAGAILAGIVGALGAIAQGVVSAVVSAIDFAASIVPALVNWVLSILAGVWGFAEGIGATVTDWARGALDAGLGALWEAVRFVWHGLVEPIADRVVALVDWIAGTLFDFLMLAIHGVEQLARDLFASVWGALNDLWHFVWDAVRPAVDLVNAAAEWLKLVALYPIRWFRDLLDLFVGMSRDGLTDWLIRGIGNEGSRLEDFVFDWLGGGGR